MAVKVPRKSTHQSHGRQQHFAFYKNQTLKVFDGGQKSHPKVKRPIPRKATMHVVLRSTKATGARSFLSPGRAKRVFAISS